MNPAIWLHRSATLYPERSALFDGMQCVANYGAFAKSASAIAAGLERNHGVSKGDRVAIFAKNCTQYLEALYGIWWAGAVAVPINAKLHAKEAAWIIENSGAKLAFSTDENLGELASVLPDCCRSVVDLKDEAFASLKSGPGAAQPGEMGHDDLVWLFYTSGTTGRPKGVMLTCGNIHAMAFSYFVDVDEVSADDTAFYAAPISHGAGIYNFMHVMKAARHAVPLSGGFDPAEIFNAGRDLGNLHMFAAPTMVKRLVGAAKDAGETGEGIKTIVYGGGPMYLADIEEAVEVLGDRFCQIYGQGESPMCITALPRHLVSDRTHPRWRERLQSVGTAQSCVEIGIADPQGNMLASGETGEILVRGAPVMKGYWQNNGATAKTLKDGWLWTGDMGAMDEDGFLTLKDRSKDVIISGGTNIYPREVEEALLTHPAVAEVSVIGKPDPEWGETVFAFVVRAAGQETDEKQLDAHCLDTIARFKRPKAYRFVDELPKNNYGKVLKTELRKLLAG